MFNTDPKNRSSLALAATIAFGIGLLIASPLFKVTNAIVPNRWI